jgi:hypothetical protein
MMPTAIKKPFSKSLMPISADLSRNDDAQPLADADKQ